MEATLVAHRSGRGEIGSPSLPLVVDEEARMLDRAGGRIEEHLTVALSLVVKEAADTVDVAGRVIQCPLSGEETLVESPFVLEYTFVKERTYSLENAILEIALIDDRSLGIADRSIAGPAHRDGMGRST